MTKTLILAAIVIAAFTAPVFAAGAIPCEDKLAQLRAAMDAAKVSETDLAKAKALEAKGVERCNADDDKRADAFFDQAMTVLAK